MKEFDFYNVVVPVGSIVPFMGKIDMDNPEKSYLNVENMGWIVCDGRTVPVNDYQELYEILGNLYGGDKTSFKIPDLRGVFLRGVGTDPGSTEDRDADPNIKDKTGVGSKQDFALQQHVHIYNAPSPPATVAGAMAAPAVSVVKPDATEGPVQSLAQQPGNVRISTIETRPINIFVNFIMKYSSKLVQTKL
jgi:microcystin-dependent protein